MQKYFISLEEFNRNILLGEHAFQIKNVLRAKVKDKFLIGVEEKTYLAEIESIENKEIKFKVVEELAGNFELPVFVSLFQGFPKADKLEHIIKYGTQLGVSEIHPVLMQRSLFKLDEKKRDSKLERFNKIAKEAAEQSFRNRVPAVLDIKKLKDVDFSGYTTKILCYEETAKTGESSVFKKKIQELKLEERVAIVVGPEGGITPEEVNYLESLGFVSVGLGPRILRTETVVFYVLSSISYEWEIRK